jgi:hypothetical protein
MPPAPGTTIVPRCRLPALRAVVLAAFAHLEEDLDPLLSPRELNIRHRPGGVESENLLVELLVIHVVDDSSRVGQPQAIHSHTPHPFPMAHARPRLLRRVGVGRTHVRQSGADATVRQTGADATGLPGTPQSCS